MEVIVVQFAKNKNFMKNIKKLIYFSLKYYYIYY